MTFEDALSHELIETIGFDYENKTFVVKLGNLDSLVTIQIQPYSDPRVPFQYVVSHNIKSPDQAAPYRSSIWFQESPEAALSKAITDLVRYYEVGVNEGHQPSEEWLVQARGVKWIAYKKA